jgi:hypothetical protein
MWNLNWDKPAKTTKEVRRAFILSDTSACWLVKWGGRYDITYTDETMLPTDIKCLSDLTLSQWVELANKLKTKNENNRINQSKW